MFAGRALVAVLSIAELARAPAPAELCARPAVPGTTSLGWNDRTLASPTRSGTRTYAYDAYMLVCAQQMGTPLLTLDDALKGHAESVGIAILEI